MNEHLLPQTREVVRELHGLSEKWPNLSSRDFNRVRAAVDKARDIEHDLPPTDASALNGILSLLSALQTHVENWSYWHTELTGLIATLEGKHADDADDGFDGWLPEADKPTI